MAIARSNIIDFSIMNECIMNVTSNDTNFAKNSIAVMACFLGR